MTALRPGAGAIASLLAGIVLIGWITGETLLLPGVQAALEVLYLAVGVAMAVPGLVALAGRSLTASPPCTRRRPGS